ncbi:MAG: hypothetical protein WCJ46_05100 [bacterium]
MENTNPQQETQPVAQQTKPNVVKKEELFSIQWHLKVLAIIYGCLAGLYIFLRLFLK